MGCDLAALCIDANDPCGQARFWAGVLGREVGADGTTLLPPDEVAFPVRFVAAEVVKTAQNLVHFDLTSTSLDDQQATVARALDLGGRHVDVGQGPDADHVVLGDPEGNEFCVIEPGNGFLDGCGTIGALAGDGTAAVGRFWSAALDWPLVWDQDEETAIQSPHGGTKITWGGPPLMPREGTIRWHVDLVPTGDADQEREVDRLVALGATRVRDEADRVVLADPDGNELCVLAAGATGLGPH